MDPVTALIALVVFWAWGSGGGEEERTEGQLGEGTVNLPGSIASQPKAGATAPVSSVKSTPYASSGAAKTVAWSPSPPERETEAELQGPQSYVYDDLTRYEAREARATSATFDTGTPLGDFRTTPY